MTDREGKNMYILFFFPCHVSAHTQLANRQITKNSIDLGVRTIKKNDTISTI